MRGKRRSGLGLAAAMSPAALLAISLLASPAAAQGSGGLSLATSPEGQNGTAIVAAAQGAGALSPAPGDAVPPETSTTVWDPFAPANEKFFAFNTKLDHYIMRPIATGWSRVAPVPLRKALARFFDNVNVIPRFANNLFQLKFTDAGGEAARFLINSTVGVAGFFDPADVWFGLKEHPQDFGTTLGYYGVGMGPYLMVPIFGPFDLRDGIGYLVDGTMNPIDWILTIVQLVYVYTGYIAVQSVNYESLNLDLFEDADRYSVDLYGAVQDAYVQHRARLLREALHPEPPQPRRPGQERPGD